MYWVNRCLRPMWRKDSNRSLFRYPSRAAIEFEDRKGGFGITVPCNGWSRQRRRQIHFYYPQFLRRASAPPIPMLVLFCVAFLHLPGTYLPSSGRAWDSPRDRCAGHWRRRSAAWKPTCSSLLGTYLSSSRCHVTIYHQFFALVLSFCVRAL